MGREQDGLGLELLRVGAGSVIHWASHLTSLGFPFLPFSKMAGGRLLGSCSRCDVSLFPFGRDHRADSIHMHSIFLGAYADFEQPSKLLCGF